MSRRLTKALMKQRLDEAGIEYAANANVAQLLQLYDQIPEEI